MNKLLSTLMLFALSHQINATLLTVNNNPGGAQYTNLGSAINAAGQGDTIYLHGSILNYGDVDIESKKLTLIGPGRGPQTANTLTAKVGRIRVYNYNNSLSNGTAIIGIEFTGSLEFASAGNVPVHNIKVIRNYFSNYNSELNLGAAGGLQTNYFVEGNFIRGNGVSFGSNHTNVTLINNVFIPNFDPNNTSRFINGLTNCTNVVFDHNLFYGNNPAQHFLTYQTIANTLFKNNIWCNIDVDNIANYNNGIGFVNCQFQNNLTFNCNNNTPWTIPNNTDLGGNIDNQNPQMTDQAAINAASSSQLLNYFITSGPAKNAGSDGKDIGVLFDTNSDMNWSYNRNTNLPYINSLTLNSTTITQGASIQVQIQARRKK